MRYFYVNQLLTLNQSTVLTGPEANHIQRVLRLRAGQTIGLFDSNGTAYTARIQSCRRDEVTVNVIDVQPASAESPTEITILQAYLKDRKMDRLVRHLTEVGITRWIPLWTRRCIPKPRPERIAGRVQRWKSISREAMKQSKRGHSMEIHTPIAFTDAMDLVTGYDLKFVFWERETRPLDSLKPEHNGSAKLKVAALLGPEGGFTDSEMAQAQTAGFESVSLGPRILRAETAAIGAAVLLQYVFGDLGKKSLTKNGPLNS